MQEASLFCCRKSLIPPMTAYQHPSARTLYPMRRHPDRSRARRTNPVAGSPNIAASIPPVITTVPCPTWMRRRTILLHHRWRWSDANLSMCCACCKRGSNECGQQKFFHRRSPALQQMTAGLNRPASLRKVALHPGLQKPPIMKLHAHFCTYCGCPRAHP